MIAGVGAADPGMFVLKSALRTAIVVPLAFALALLVIEVKQTALFAAFGSMALLVFVDFGGSRRTRLRAYLLLLAAGAVLIAVGTLCSRSTWLATVAMAVVAFAILFAGVLSDYVAAARSAAILTFVLPVMVVGGRGGDPGQACRLGPGGCAVHPGDAAAVAGASAQRDPPGSRAGGACAGRAGEARSRGDGGGTGGGAERARGDGGGA